MIFSGTACQLYGTNLFHSLFFPWFIFDVFGWVCSYLFWMFIKTCWYLAFFTILCILWSSYSIKLMAGSQKTLFKVLVIGTSTNIPSRGQGPDSFRDGMTICLFLVVPHGWLSNISKACLLYLSWGQVKDFSTTHLAPDPDVIIFIKIICLPPPLLYGKTLQSPAIYFCLSGTEWRQTPSCCPLGFGPTGDAMASPMPGCSTAKVFATSESPRARCLPSLLCSALILMPWHIKNANRCHQV